MSILDGIKGDGKLQTEKKIAVKKDIALEKKVDEIVRKYEVWLEESRELSWEADYKDACQELDGTTIDHQTIDEFCIRIKDYQNAAVFEDSGLFLSAMLQNAYDHGHNDFRINTQHLEKDIGFIGACICGKSDEPIKVIIDGDAGRWCGERAEHFHFTSRGNAGDWCGNEAKHSLFIFEGDAGGGCGSEAEHSYFTFMGDAGDNCGKVAEHSEFTFMGDAGSWCGEEAKHSEFTFMGDAGEFCGWDAEHSLFMLHGSVGEWCAKRAIRSKFTFMGKSVNPNYAYAAVRCDFYSPHIEVIKNNTRKKRGTCRYYLIEPDGTSREVSR